MPFSRKREEEINAQQQKKKQSQHANHQDQAAYPNLRHF
jgi:hypothetical protein